VTTLIFDSNGGGRPLHQRRHAFALAVDRVGDERNHRVPVASFSVVIEMEAVFGQQLERALGIVRVGRSLA